MVHPRVALASGVAAAAGAALILIGRLDGSAATVLVLVLVARATGPAASTDPASARALARQGALIPVWVGVVVVAALRAGSASMADIRGANAVAGPALTHGAVLMVAGCWIALAAGILATALPVVIAPPLRRMEWIGAGLQGIVLVELFAGPQVTRAADAVVWVAAAGGVVAAAVMVRRWMRWERAAALATGLAVVAFASALAGGRL